MVRQTCTQSPCTSKKVMIGPFTTGGNLGNFVCTPFFTLRPQSRPTSSEYRNSHFHRSAHSRIGGTHERSQRSHTYEARAHAFVHCQMTWRESQGHNVLRCMGRIAQMNFDARPQQAIGPEGGISLTELAE